MGSTAVRGLDAKPIIDIDVSVADVEQEDAYLPALLAAGYELRVRQAGHRMVRTPARDVHVHICSAGSDWERRHLLFRDWLRKDSADRDAYGALKRALAAQQWPDMNAYSEAKGDLIGRIMARAEAWASATGWKVRGVDAVTPPVRTGTLLEKAPMNSGSPPRPTCFPTAPCPAGADG